MRRWVWTNLEVTVNLVFGRVMQKLLFYLLSWTMGQKGKLQFCIPASLSFRLNLTFRGQIPGVGTFHNVTMSLQNRRTRALLFMHQFLGHIGTWNTELVWLPRLLQHWWNQDQRKPDRASVSGWKRHWGKADQSKPFLEKICSSVWIHQCCNLKEIDH